MYLKPLHLEICPKRIERKEEMQSMEESKGTDDKLKGDGMQ